MQKANGVFSDYSSGNCRKDGCLSTRVVTFTNTSPILLQVRLEVGNLLGPIISSAILFTAFL